MSQLSDLKKEGKSFAEIQNHNIGNFHRVRSITGQEIWRAFCEKCNMVVTVIPNPKPNQAKISGNAIALNCEE